MADQQQQQGKAAIRRERLRDPWGRFMDLLPWPLRRLWLAARLRTWPPDEARLVGFRRPSDRDIAYFRRLHGLEDE